MKIFTLIISLLTICTSWATEGQCNELRTALHEGAFNVLSDPDRVLIIAESPVLLSKDQTEKLQEILLNDESYFFDLCKDAVFTNDTLFIFKKGTEEVRVVLSHHAEQILFKNAVGCVVLDCDPCFEALMHFIDSVRAPCIY